MKPLRWRSAETRHQGALNQFICTDPAKRSYDRYRGKHHPKPWELEVQSHLRGLRAPVNDGEALLLGFDDVGLASAAHFGFDDQGEHLILWAIARAQRCAGRGYGVKTLEAVLDTMAATKRALGIDCVVFSYVDPRNGPSEKLLRNAGFEFLNMYEGYQGWVRDL